MNKKDKLEYKHFFEGSRCAIGGMFLGGLIVINFKSLWLILVILLLIINESSADYVKKC